MLSDPIVDEIHRIREKLLEEHGGDLGKYMERLKDLEKEHPERLAAPMPVRPPKLRAEPQPAEKP